MREKKVHPIKEEKKSYKTNKIEITGIFMVLLGFFVCLSLVGYGMGIVGNLLRNGFYVLFGVASFPAALVFIIVGAGYALTGNPPRITRQICLSSMAIWILLAGYHHYALPAGNEFSVASFMSFGGALGGIPVGVIRLLAGNIGTGIILFGLFVVDILLLTHWSVSSGAKKVGKRTEKKLSDVKYKIREKREEYYSARDAAVSAGKSYHLADFIFKKPIKNNSENNDTRVLLQNENFIERQDEKSVEETLPESVSVAADLVTGSFEYSPETKNINSLMSDEIKEERDGLFNESSDIPAEKHDDNICNPRACIETETVELPDTEDKTAYEFPPLTLLNEEKATQGSEGDAYGKAYRLETTLKSFGVNAKVINVSIGPSVTRYELEPAPGVRVSKIEGLADDIALQLAATSIRIEAPIPGKSAVGIEIPNAKTASVSLREVLSVDTFQKGKGKILVALGKDISGNVVITDLAKMPHLLIAGQTGSGKSVCINTIITSILYHSRPEEVKLILIDPKVVELSIYNGIPHLRMPVVTQAKKAAAALNWAVKEMEERYQSFAEKNVRDINGFNKQNPALKMPFIVVIIDELADLMMVAKDSVEDAICRLAQKARAAGIHLVVATQRPSVDVITGLIKANIPSRISFAVSSQVDSRTILDKAGAEKLLGKGDMLFDPSGAANPLRVQGAFISDEEVESVVSYIKEKCLQQETILVEEEEIDLSKLEPTVSAVAEEQADELLPEAAEWVIDTKRASVSALQRRFRIGYTRAGRLMDTMEMMGIVTKADGAKPREVLIAKGQLKELFPDGSDA